MYEFIKQIRKTFRNVGYTVVNFNKELNDFFNSETFKELLNILANIPDDIQESELYHHIMNLATTEITYDEIKWMKEMFNHTSYNDIVHQFVNKKSKSILEQYMLSIIESDYLSPREKIVVLLAHFEDFIFQSISYNRIKRDKVKHVISSKFKNAHTMEIEDFRIVILAGIIFIIFSNTDSYKNKIDMRIPFRNNILHRGTMSYSDNEIKEAYETLVLFIAEISSMEDNNVM